METVPTASTKKMRIRSKSTSDVGDTPSNDFTTHTVGGKDNAVVNGKAANFENSRREKQPHDRKSRSGLRGLPKKGTETLLLQLLIF